MAIIGGNGLLVLVLSALFLAYKAGATEFDTAFYVVQVIELIAAAVNLTLIRLNVGEGPHLPAKCRRS